MDRTAAAVLVVLAMSSHVCCAQQTLPPSGPLSEMPSAQIGYASPIEAQMALESKPGISIRHEQGWTIVKDLKDSQGLALWSFTPPDHPAHPSAVKRVIFQKDGKVWMDMAVSCGASKEVCDSLVRQFHGVTERVQQSLQGGAP